MRTFLAKCCVVGLIAGGFAFTGDAGRLLARGRGVIEATTVPRDAADEIPISDSAESSPGISTSTAPESSPLSDASPQGIAAVAPLPSEATAAASPPSVPSPSSSPAQTVPPADAPVGTPIAANPPPAGAPAAVDVARLAAGDRVMIWIGRRDGRSRMAGTTVAFDLVDPATGECLEVRHPNGEENAALHAPCRRVRIVGSVADGFLGTTGPLSAGRIIKKQSLQLTTVAIDGGNSATIETIGPVLGVTVSRP